MCVFDTDGGGGAGGGVAWRRRRLRRRRSVRCAVVVVELTDVVWFVCSVMTAMQGGNADSAPPLALEPE